LNKLYDRRGDALMRLGQLPDRQAACFKTALEEKTKPVHTPKVQTG
jgi:hypothetical protein